MYISIQLYSVQIHKVCNFHRVPDEKWLTSLRIGKRGARETGRDFGCAVRVRNHRSFTLRTGRSPKEWSFADLLDLWDVCLHILIHDTISLYDMAVNMIYDMIYDIWDIWYEYMIWIYDMNIYEYMIIWDYMYTYYTRKHLSNTDILIRYATSTVQCGEGSSLIASCTTLLWVLRCSSITLLLSNCKKYLTRTDWFILICVHL